MIRVFVTVNNAVKSIDIPDGTRWNPYDENGIVIYNKDRKIVAAFNFSNIVGLYVEGDFKKQTEVEELCSYEI